MQAVGKPSHCKAPFGVPCLLGGMYLGFRVACKSVRAGKNRTGLISNMLLAELLSKIVKEVSRKAEARLYAINHQSHEPFKWDLISYSPGKAIIVLAECHAGFKTSFMATWETSVNMLSRNAKVPDLCLPFGLWFGPSQSRGDLYEAS